LHLLAVIAYQGTVAFYSDVVLRWLVTKNSLMAIWRFLKKHQHGFFRAENENL